MARKQIAASTARAPLAFASLDDAGKAQVASNIANSVVQCDVIDGQANEAKQAVYSAACDAMPRLTEADFTRSFKGQIVKQMVDSGRYKDEDVADKAFTRVRRVLIALTNRPRPEDTSQGAKDGAKQLELRKQLDFQPGESITAFANRVPDILKALGVLDTKRRQSNKKGTGKDTGDTGDTGGKDNGKSVGVSGASRKDLAVGLAQGSEPLALAFEAIAGAPRAVQAAFLRLYNEEIAPLIPAA